MYDFVLGRVHSRPGHTRAEGGGRAPLPRGVPGQQASGRQPARRPGASCSSPTAEARGAASRRPRGSGGAGAAQQHSRSPLSGARGPPHRTAGRGGGGGREREPGAAAAVGLCLQAWAAGKGEVTSSLPGICCLEASPWRPEGSGWVKIANPRGCKFQERSLCKEREARARSWRGRASARRSAGGASGFQALPLHAGTRLPVPAARELCPQAGCGQCGSLAAGDRWMSGALGLPLGGAGEVSAGGTGGSPHRPPRLLPQKEEAGRWGRPPAPSL